MLDFIVSLGPWAWIIAGLILLGLELLAPGVFLIWFGIAALITGGIVFVTDWSWQIDLIIFVVLAVIAVFIGRKYFSGRGQSEDPFLNQRAQRHIGTTHVLADPIVDGQGRIRIDDTNWRVSGPDMPPGSRVRVSAVAGAVLAVVRAD